MTSHRRWRIAADLLAGVLFALVIPGFLLELLLVQPAGRAPWVATATTTLLCVAAVAWCVVLTSLARSIWAHLHHRGSFDGRINRFAGRIAVALSLTFGFASNAGAATPSSTTAHHAVMHHEGQSPASATANSTPASTYTVRDGDCLWTIAEQFYGDGRKYRAILEANFGQVFGRGERFENPRIIRTGWVLTIPKLPTAPNTAHVTALAATPPGALHTTPTTTEVTPRQSRSVQTAPPTPMTQTQPSPSKGAAVAHDDDLLHTIGALGLGLLAGAAASRRRRALADDDAVVAPHSTESDAALRLGDEVVKSGLVDAVVAALEARGHVGQPEGAQSKDPHHVEPAPQVALVLGRREHTTEVALVERGTTVSIVGPHRKGLIALQRLLAPTWGDHLGAVPTSSATHAADHVALVDPRTVVYFGDARDLDPKVAEQSIIVTDQPGGSLTIVAGEDVTHVGEDTTLSTLSVPHHLERELTALCHDEEPLDECADQPATRPQVRLLTPVPRIDGLAGDLDRKRARRGVELAAYLSLHREHLVTGGQLRMELLGDSEQDGSPKNLSNTVSALRRALGVDGDGNPHLPPATRSGCYAISPSVTSDYEQALEHLESARASEGDAKLAFVRAACDLIEGAPLSSCVLGYDWYFREGHDQVLARALSAGIAAVLDDAIRDGYVELARSLIAKASLINPYSETLARGAMTLAAASNDVDQLQHAWNAHLARLDELEPGLSPSATTEAHFWRLHGICAGRLNA